MESKRIFTFSSKSKYLEYFHKKEYLDFGRYKFQGKDEKFMRKITFEIDISDGK